MKDNIEQKLSKGYKEADIYSLDVDGGTYAGRGYFYISPVNGELAGEELLKSWSVRSKEQITGYPLKYIKKIIKYCRDNDIDLIAVTSPITPSSVGILHMENVHDTINCLLTMECSIMISIWRDRTYCQERIRTLLIKKDI